MLGKGMHMCIPYICDVRRVHALYTRKLILEVLLLLYYYYYYDYDYYHYYHYYSACLSITVTRRHCTILAGR